MGRGVAAPLCRGASRTATERRDYIIPAPNGGAVLGCARMRQVGRTAQ